MAPSPLRIKLALLRPSVQLAKLRETGKKDSKCNS